MKRKIRWNRILYLCLPIILCIFIVVLILSLNYRKDTDMNDTDTYTPTLERFLEITTEPLGQTMYVWGGGWNEEDTGAGVEATTIGVPNRWKEFYEEQDSSYDYTKTTYQIHDGLDCSGYVGWCIYNLINTTSGKDGYVMLSGSMASAFSSYGWGSFEERGSFSDFSPGDILSNDEHVYICLGTCSDGSVLLIHSSPPGVRICGTDSFGTGRSDAIDLADKIMKENYSDWYSIFPDVTVDTSYLTNYDRFHWNEDTLSDASKIQSLSAEQVVDLLWK